MARNDGVNRTTVRNANLTKSQIENAQHHNEREKRTYVNQDIILERTPMNVHYKTPNGDYDEMFEAMKEAKIISTRGLKEDAKVYGELIFDVNSAYFYNHGGYEFAKKYYEEAYKAAIEIIGGEQYILSAVMHADERNKAMSEALGEDVWHYHLHVVYIPVVEKQVLWTKRCKDKSLVGTVKETIMQVSSSKKWESKPATDEFGKQIIQENGKPALRKSYSVLQDDYFNHMYDAGYLDLERGEHRSTEEHLTVTQFKVKKERERLQELQKETEKAYKNKQEAQHQLDEIAPILDKTIEFSRKFIEEAEEILPEAGALETAKTYREKKAIPFVKHFKDVMKSLYRSYLELKDKYNELVNDYISLQNNYNSLIKTNEYLTYKIEFLEKIQESFDYVQQAFGKSQVEKAIERVKEQDYKAMRERERRQERELSR